MKVILYNLKEITPTNNKTVKFTNITSRSEFFDSLPKEELELDLSPAWIRNIWNLYNEITIFNEGRFPHTAYNYVMIQHDIEHYYYITGYEEIGNNQIRYFLKKDTLMTYVTTPSMGVDIESNLALVVREHKNRFDNNGNPIFNKTIEDIDIMPSNLSNVKTWNETNSITLALKQFGGNVDNGNVLSYPLAFWEIYPKNKKTITNNNYTTFPFVAGWGFERESYRIEIYHRSGYVAIDANGVITLKKENNGWYIKRISPINGENWTINSNHISHLDSDNFTYVNNEKIYINDSLGKETVDLFIEADGKLYYDCGIESQATPKIFGLSDITSKSDLLVNPFDAKVSKMISLPYDFQEIMAKGHIVGNDNGMYLLALSKIEFLIQDNSNKLEHTFTYNFDTSKFDKTRVKYNDPKLWHSQFRPIYMTWFSEAITLKHERLGNNQVKFKTELSTGSYNRVKIYNNNPNYEEEKPYETSKSIDLNNEIATISNDLDAYLRYQAENDIKLMQLQQAMATRNLWQSGVNAATGIAAGAVGGMMVGNIPGAIVGASVGAIRAGMNIGFQIANHKDQQKQRELEYEQKLVGLQNSLINIAGQSPEMAEVDDSNKIKLWEIKPTIEELDYLDLYFHRYGYKTLEYKKPVLKTRKYFDYKQMIIDELVETAVITEEVRQDIKDRFAAGVTIFHYPYGTTDFNQNKENWEV